MKNNSLLAVLTTLITSSAVHAQDEPVVYLHGFRSPSIGGEYRLNKVGFHGGLYTTILGQDGNRSTEFVKLGATLYSRKADSKQELFGGVSYLRGLNREFKNKNGVFFEFGTRFRLSPRWDFRFGNGLLFSQGSKPHFNPTIGISYSIPIR